MYTRSYKNISGKSRLEIPFKYDGTAIESASAPKANEAIGEETAEHEEVSQLSDFAESENVQAVPLSSDEDDIAVNGGQVIKDEKDEEAVDASSGMDALDVEERISLYGDALPRYPLEKKRELVSDDSAPSYGTRPRYPASGIRGRWRSRSDIPSGAVPTEAGVPLSDAPASHTRKGEDTVKAASADIHVPDTYISNVDDLIIAILVLLLMSREDS